MRLEHFKLYTLETKFSDFEQFKRAFKLDFSCDDGFESISIEQDTSEKIKQLLEKFK